jgi:hypothetical protein
MRRETTKAGDDCEELRCLCGSLLARLVPGGVELKCRRCRRTCVVPLEPGHDGGAQRERAPER